MAPCWRRRPILAPAGPRRHEEAAFCRPLAADCLAASVPGRLQIELAGRADARQGEAPAARQLAGLLSEFFSKVACAAAPLLELGACQGCREAGLCGSWRAQRPAEASLMFQVRSRAAHNGRGRSLPPAGPNRSMRPAARFCELDERTLPLAPIVVWPLRHSSAATFSTLRRRPKSAAAAERCGAGCATIRNLRAGPNCQIRNRGARAGGTRAVAEPATGAVSAAALAAAPQIAAKVHEICKCVAPIAIFEPPPPPSVAPVRPRRASMSDTSSGRRTRCANEM